MWERPLVCPSPQRLHQASRTKPEHRHVGQFASKIKADLSMSPIVVNGNTRRKITLKGLNFIKSGRKLFFALTIHMTLLYKCIFFEKKNRCTCYYRLFTQ